jgi:acyl carrier protein
MVGGGEGCITTGHYSNPFGRSSGFGWSSGRVVFISRRSIVARAGTIMTREQIKEIIFRVLGEIAPEMNPTQIKPDVSLRDQLDIDSMDFLNFVIALHKETRVDIPEIDYPKLLSLQGCMDYLASKIS